MTFSDKVYSSGWEKEVRSRIFQTNIKYILEHNELYVKGEKSYYLGLNQFTDLVSSLANSKFSQSVENGPRVNYKQIRELQ